MEENFEKDTVVEETSETVQTGSEAASEVITSEMLTGGKPKKNWKKEAWEWIISIAIALMVVFFIRNYLFQIIRVDGSSMYNTLEDGDRLFVSVLDVKFKGIERNDMMICHYPNRGATDFVKRCVAVPGDTVMRKSNITYVRYGDSGLVVALDPMNARSAYYAGDDYEYTLGENEYFAVGDNRANSHDSRDWHDNTPDDDVGPITKDMIVGKVQHIIWPLSRFGNAYEVDSTWNNFYNVELPQYIEEHKNNGEEKAE